MAITEAPQQGQIPDRQPVGPRRISRRNLLIGVATGAGGLAVAGGLAALNKFGISGDEDGNAVSGGFNTGIDSDSKLPSSDLISPNNEIGDLSTQPQPDEILTQPAPEATKSPEKEPKTLREAADRIGFKISVMAEKGGNDNDRFRIIKDQFNKMTIASISMNTVAGVQGNYDFHIPDFFVDMAIRNNQEMAGVHLVYGNLDSIPKWLSEGNFTNEQMLGIMQDHINTVITKYKGRINEWSVVNEGTTPNFWNKRFGTSYIEPAFRTARAADPNATLIYNDFGGEYQGAGKADRIFAIVNNLKQKGLVDAVGMQMHMIGEGPNIDPLNPPTKEQIIAEMRRYADIGVKVIITELDLVANRFPGNLEEQQRKQAELFRLPIEAAIESGGACRSISLWGVNDETSWKKEGSPLLFSKNTPKPAFYAVMDAFAQAAS